VLVDAKIRASDKDLPLCATANAISKWNEVYCFRPRIYSFFPLHCCVIARWKFKWTGLILAIAFALPFYCFLSKYILAVENIC
jgi:hypothetical protein